MDTRELITQYYASLNAKDDAWKSMWAEGAVFADASRTLSAEGKQAVIASFDPFLNGVRAAGVIESIVDGFKACFVVRYTYMNQKSETLVQDVAEVWEVDGEKLSSLTIYFDLTAYGSFMRG